MVFTHTLRPCQPTPSWRWKQSAHLCADSPKELHDFAQAIGLKPEWFQYEKGRCYPHYDLNGARWGKAMKMGAVVIPIRDLLTRLKKATDPHEW